MPSSGRAAAPISLHISVLREFRPSGKERGHLYTRSFRGLVDSELPTAATETSSQDEAAV